MKTLLGYAFDGTMANSIKKGRSWIAIVLTTMILMSLVKSPVVLFAMLIIVAGIGQYLLLRSRAAEQAQSYWMAQLQPPPTIAAGVGSLVSLVT